MKKALAWSAYGTPNSPDKSNSAYSTRRWNLFSYTLLYDSECWTLKPTLQKSLDWCYTRMLPVVLNISKSAHVTNENLYAGIFRVSNKIAARRMRLVGRPTLTYVDVLKKDTGAQSTHELARCMENQDACK